MLKYLFSDTYQQEIRQLFHLALPITLGQLGIMLMGVADTIQVGHIETDAKLALDAAGVANGVWITIGILGFNSLTVIAPMISKAHAENDTPKVITLFRSSFSVAIIASALCMLAMFAVSFNLDMLGQDAHVVALAKPYFQLIIFGFFFQCLFLAFRQLSDGLSHTRVAMYITLSAVVINVAFNHLLINGIWVFPKWGLLGAGVATLISRVYMAAAMWLYLRNNTIFEQYLRKLPPTSELLVLPIFKVGIPAGLQGFFEIAVFAFAQIMIGWISTDQQAAHLIAISPASVSYMMVTGLAVAGGIRVGQGLGLRSQTVVQQAGRVSLMMSMAFMGIFCLVFLLFPEFVVGLYINDPAVATIAVILVMVAGVFQLADGTQTVSLGLLRGLGDVNIPTLITLVSYWVVGLPIGAYFAFEQNMEALGVWIGLTVGLVAASVLLTWRFFGEAKKLNFEQNK